MKNKLIHKTLFPFPKKITKKIDKKKESYSCRSDK